MSCCQNMNQTVLMNLDVCIICSLAQTWPCLSEWTGLTAVMLMKKEHSLQPFYSSEINCDVLATAVTGNRNILGQITLFPPPFPPLSLCVFLRIILSSSFPGCIRFLCASLLSVLLLVCQMMYSRCSSSTAIVGPWRILNNTLSRSLCSLSFSLPNACTGSSVGSMSGCTVVDVAVFEVCSWDQSVALLNNPLTRPSIFTSLSPFLFFSISLSASSPQQDCSISHLLESSPARAVLPVTMINCFLPNAEHRISLA